MSERVRAGRQRGAWVRGVGATLACAVSSLAVSSLAADAPSADATLAHRLAVAADTSLPYPDVPDGLSADAAYAVQRAMVAELAKRSPIAGHKGGLTDAAAQARFHAPGPVSGALLGSGRLGEHASVLLDADDKVMIEVEIGYVLRNAVAQPLGAADDPLAHVAAVVPAVELPNLNFAGAPALADIIASDVSAQQFIVGAPVAAPEWVALDALTVRLARDDVQVAAGHGSAALGSQREALRWLINDRLAHGDRLEAGQVLITGALAGMLPAAPGHYLASYGALGSLEFTVRGPSTAAAPSH